MMMNGMYTNIEMEVLENPGYETEGTDGKQNEIEREQILLSCKF